MGGASSSCTGHNYRFKNFVVSVYPDDVKDGPNEDALGKLNSYVASNPERIPRVCRKVYKIMRVHMQYHKPERVMVSVKMLRSLIEHAKTVDGFVPYSVLICGQLLASSDMRYKVGAADILTILCHRLTQSPNSEPSRRLIADSKDHILRPLRTMCVLKASKEGGSEAAATAMRTRFAAVVAIGQLARCLGGVLASNVMDLLFPVVSDLLAVMRARANKPVDANLSIESALRSDLSSSSSAATAAASLPTSAELPKSGDADVVYARACVFAAGAVTGCATAANLEEVLGSLIRLLDDNGGWAVPLAPEVIFRALIVALQQRPQGLGFAVFQALCAADNGSEDPAVRISILHALNTCVLVLPMSGGRPQLVLAYLRTAILAAPVSTKDANAKPMLNAIVLLTGSLLKSIYSQRNAPQLQSVLAMLARQLSNCTTAHVEPNEGSSSSETVDIDKLGASSTANSSRTYLALRCMAAAAPYVRTTPLVDRQNGALSVCSIIEPLLNSSNDAYRTWAARALRGILAGTPEDAGGSTSSAVNASTGALDVLSTDESDIVFAEAWITKTLQNKTNVTPRCVVEVGHVLTAIMASYGVNALPFVLTTLWATQNRCVSGQAKAAHDPHSHHTVTSSTPSSPLSRAWLQMTLAVLDSCGRIYEMPKLSAYAREVLARRQTLKPNELADCFDAELRTTSRPAHRFTVCGLAVASGARKDAVLSAEPTLGPVTKLPSFSYVASIIVDADREDVIDVFGAAAANDLKAAIERVSFSADSEAKVSRDHSAIVNDAHPSELRNGEAFSLHVSKQQLAALSKLQVSLVDSYPGMHAATAAGNDVGSPLSPVNASNTADRISAVLERFSVDASTGLLPPDAHVDPSPPLCNVAPQARDSLVRRSSSLRVAAANGKASDGDRDHDDDDSRSNASLGSAQEDARAQVDLASANVSSVRGKGSLAVALKMQQVAQRADSGIASGDLRSQIGVADTPRQRPWFSMLPSSQYVDLD